MPTHRISSTFLLSMCLALVPGLSSAVDQRGTTPAELPLAAQSVISEVLGRDLPEFAVRRDGDRFRAENAQQNLATDFSSSGVEVRNGQAHCRFSLRGYGYGDDLEKVGPTVPHFSANRVEYRRGALIEWYVNGPMGLEQGFTIGEAHGRSHGRPLTIELGLAGNLKPELRESDMSLALKRADGSSALRYGGLAAVDADGKDLRATIEMVGGDLKLLVEDAGARYPVRIDPVVRKAELTTTDVSYGTTFGWSVAISGDTVVVGAPEAQVGSKIGAAYVFVKPPTGWADMTQTATLTTSNPNSRGFGSPVAIDRDTVVIGDDLVNGSSIAEVFVKPPGGWVDMTESAKLTSADALSLGTSLAIDGNTIVAGATKRDGSAVYVYVKPRGGWKDVTQVAELTSPDGSNYDLGYAVSVSGDTIVAGAPELFRYDNPPSSAYVFVKPPTGWRNMTETARLTSSDGVSEDHFGYAVAVKDDTVVVGAPSTYNGGETYVFKEPASGWVDMTETARLTASDESQYDGFGTAVGIDHAIVAVGSEFNNLIGAVYVYLKPKSGWKTTSTYSAKLTVDDNSYDGFGSFVAISGHTLVAGAPRQSVGGIDYQGAAYVFFPQ